MLGALPCLKSRVGVNFLFFFPTIHLLRHLQFKIVRVSCWYFVLYFTTGFKCSHLFWPNQTNNSEEISKIIRPHLSNFFVTGELPLTYGKKYKPFQTCVPDSAKIYSLIHEKYLQTHRKQKLCRNNKNIPVKKDVGKMISLFALLYKPVDDEVFLLF